MQSKSKNPHHLEKLKQQIQSQGKEQTFWVFDFDKTLTYENNDGKKTPSIIALLRDGEYLGPEYSQKAHELFNHYHPFETNLVLSLEEKRAKMDEWRLQHNQLLIDSKLEKKDLLAIAKSPQIQLRKRVKQLLDQLAQNQTPVVIFSASGAGDAILEFMKINVGELKNIFYLLNYFTRDAVGYALATQGPVIHSLNKSEQTFRQIPKLQARTQEKKTAILVGDGLGDAQMVDPNLHEVVLKI